MEFVKPGMTLGLGTGSTVFWTIQKLGELVKQGLQIRGVPTSHKTEIRAKQAGIPLISFADVEQLDLTIDGADEINPHLDLIKGGGGALLREKLVAASSRRLIIVADHSKRVPNLGGFLLPVEVIPFAWETTFRRIESLGCIPTLRLSVSGLPYQTDNGNYIMDCDFKVISNPLDVHQKLKLLTGVIETGLFVSMADMVIIAGPYGIDLLTRGG